MIFDSPRMQTLLSKYKYEPDFLVPGAVFLARSAKLEGERLYIESIIRQVTSAKQKEWLSRLVSNDDAQHLSAWLEIMLFGWMTDIGEVEVEPIVKGNYPDLSIVIGTQKAYIEARVILKTHSEKDDERLLNWIFWALRKIKKPFAIDVIDGRASRLPVLEDFIMKVEQWLETTPQERYSYEDGYATIVLEVLGDPNPKYGSIQAIGGSVGEAKRISSEPLKSPLKEKAYQHKEIRKASFPYIITLFLESPYLSAEEVVKAWFGEEKLVIKAVGDKYKVVDSYIDKSGLHFYGSEIRHTSVSGTLVFKAEYVKSDKRHYLKSWYIQNPFAHTHVDSSMLPVQGRFIVLERDEKGFKMAWRSGKEFRFSD